LKLAAFLIAAVVVGACSSDSTGSNAPTAHPDGTTVTATILNNGPWGAAVSSQGVVYVTRPLTDSVALVNLTGPTVTASFQVGHRPDDVAFNDAGDKAYVTNLDDNTVGVINTTTGIQTTTFPVGGQPFRILVGPGGGSLYVTRSDGYVVVLNAATGAIDTTIAVGSTPNGLALNKTTGKLYVSAAGSGFVTEINTSNNSTVRTLLVGGTPQDIAVVNSRNALYVANEDGYLDIWNLGSGARSDSVGLHAPFGLAVTPDGEQAWVTQPTSSSVSVVNLTTHEISDSIPVGGTPRHIAFTPSGKVAVLANETGAVETIK
jgi:YVTN family beta-propeller protein